MCSLALPISLSSIPLLTLNTPYRNSKSVISPVVQIDRRAEQHSLPRGSLSSSIVIDRDRLLILDLHLILPPYHGYHASRRGANPRRRGSMVQNAGRCPAELIHTDHRNGISSLGEDVDLKAPNAKYSAEWQRLRKAQTTGRTKYVLLPVMPRESYASYHSTDSTRFIVSTGRLRASIHVRLGRRRCLIE